MNQDPMQPWRDALLRRELTGTEEREVAAWLAEHPGAVDDWKLDTALARSLRRLPEVPVASNFTARVMAEVRREQGKAGAAAAGSMGSGGAGWRRWFGGEWLPVLGGAALMMAVGFGGWQVRVAQRDSAYVREVAVLRVIADLPPAVLEDFDAIRRYGESGTPVDFGLLAAME